ncbi:MAG: hypothetical protein ACOX2M_09340 [Fastidiosipilaceae bacterium]|jgi:hypothetical protein
MTNTTSELWLDRPIRLRPTFPDLDPAMVSGTLRATSRHAPDDTIDAQVERQLSRLKQVAKPACVYRLIDQSEPDLDLCPTDMALERPSTERSILLFAMTMGAEVDRLIRAEEIIRLDQAVILDRCAVLGLSVLVDRIWEELAERLSASGLYLSDRNFPGDPGFPLRAQTKICDLLNSGRAIGLTVNSKSLFLEPLKSVTMLARTTGQRETGFRISMCETCGHNNDCPYRSAQKPEEGKTNE